MDGALFLFFTWRLTEEVKKKSTRWQIPDVYPVWHVVNSLKQICENIRLDQHSP